MLVVNVDWDCEVALYRSSRICGLWGDCTLSWVYSNILMFLFIFVHCSVRSTKGAAPVHSRAEMRGYRFYSILGGAAVLAG